MRLAAPQARTDGQSVQPHPGGPSTGTSKSDPKIQTPTGQTHPGFLQARRALDKSALVSNKADVIDDLHRTSRGGGPRPAVVSNLPEIGRKARAILVSKLGPHTFPPQAAAQAHHIFPVDLFLEPFGRKLSNLGIDLNGAENGVWLPKFDYPGRKASIHNGRTCGSYIDKIRQMFDAAETHEDALAILKQLREDLENGKLLINGATGVRLQMSRVL